MQELHWSNAGLQAYPLIRITDYDRDNLPDPNSGL